MGLDLWFKDDLRRILDSKEQAVMEFNGDGLYRLGYLACIVHLRTEFGLNEQAAQYEVKAERRVSTSPPCPDTST